MTSTQLPEINDFRHIRLPDQSTYSPYCSELVDREGLLGCRATGDPVPTIDIYREHDDGTLQRFDALYQGNGELVVSISPLSYGKTFMYHCIASNTASFVSISVNLTYTCKYIVVECIYIYIHWVTINAMFTK